jgi:hypothetical protein
LRISKDLPLPDLAALVCDACLKNAIDVVLSGGACVSIFTENIYASYDLDFVLRSPVDRKRIKTTMGELGFREDGRHFRHPKNPYIVEFLSPPLSVGQEPVREIQEIRRGKMILRLLSPTDCVKDRLAAFFHWNDRPSLNQAILVCKKMDVDLREVRRWSINEGMKDKFELFKEALSESGSK